MCTTQHRPRWSRCKASCCTKATGTDFTWPSRTPTASRPKSFWRTRYVLTIRQPGVRQLGTHLHGPAVHCSPQLLQELLGMPIAEYSRLDRARRNEVRSACPPSFALRLLPFYLVLSACTHVLVAVAQDGAAGRRDPLGDASDDARPAVPQRCCPARGDCVWAAHYTVIGPLGVGPS